MRTLITTIAAACLLAACDRPQCKNTNPVFDKYAPESNEYRAELITQLKHAQADRVRFWIDKYSKKDSMEYMGIFIQGSGLCATTNLDITKAMGLDDYKRVKGMSYNGGELSGLTFKIDTSTGNYNFVFENVVRIID